MDSSRSSIRIHHTHHAKVGAVGPMGPMGSHSPPVPPLPPMAPLLSASQSPRFPKLDECAHFHYENVDLGALQVSIINDQDLSLGSRLHCEDVENQSFTVQVASQGKSWLLRRSYQNFRSLDSQLHRCIYDRKFSALPQLPPEDNLSIPPGQEHEEAVQNLLADYLIRFSSIAGNLINCGPVLSWFELDNRGRRLLVPDNDSCPINTPAVAAAYSVKRYSAQAPDEISFEVNDMISVIDMPPPEESLWWRGKRADHRAVEVGFFPSDCVALIGDKVPRNLQLSAGVSAPNSPRDMMLVCQPSKPVLRKHGKLISFFRSFILARPSRRRLKQSGILKERVFGCDLGEHLLNSGHDIPMVLKCCSEFIETHGIVDGIYRLSGVTSNIQKLRNAFDEDRVPGLYEDEAILQDIHSVASLLKMYFRELPNPLCTYQLYQQFVGAVQNKDGTTRDGPDENRDSTRLMLMRDAVQQLPPPHYRTLQYLMRHLARVAEHGHQTGMTPRNVAIVWAPNLLRSKALEVGGVAALQGVGVQAVVTEFLICYADLIFCDRLPALSIPVPQATPKRCRPKSLAISTPTKLLSLEEARTRALLSAAGKTDQDYIEVGGGPSSLPAKYHTVIELPSRKRPGSKRSPLGWKSFFSKAGRGSSGSGTHSSRKVQQQQQQPQQQQLKPQRKTSTPSVINFGIEKAVTESDLAPGRRRLRPVKSAESLASGNNSSRNSAALSHGSDVAGQSRQSSQAVSPADGLAKAGHNRSVSHDSYFDHLAETPSMSRRASSRLHEEEGFSSSLDLSEIQLNFELEESEMRIFSEDETLLSTCDSNSVMSQGSPHARLGAAASALPRDRHVRNSLGVGKRLTPHGVPNLARPEDSLSGGCASLDPSPKKQKTSSGGISTKGELCKRSRLEEQLTSSTAELRYIDSQSPEQVPVQQQVVVHAEVHHGAPASTSSSLNEALNAASDTESVTLLSSGLTTPDTPLQMYRPLQDDGESSGSGVGSTPDYENMTASASKLSPLEPRYEQLIGTPCTPSPCYDGIPVPKPRFQTPRTPYENVQREFLANTLKSDSKAQPPPPPPLPPPPSLRSPYENMQREFVIVEGSDSAAASSPPPSSSSQSLASLSAGTTAMCHLESSGDDDTLEISQDNFSLDLNAGFDHMLSEIKSGAGAASWPGDDAEGCIMVTDPCDVDESVAEAEVAVDVFVPQPAAQNVYQNVPNVSMEGTQAVSRSDDDVYEEYAFDKSEKGIGNENQQTACGDAQSHAPLDPNVVYQQVKYLRRSIHEVNALLEDTATAVVPVPVQSEGAHSDPSRAKNDTRFGAPHCDVAEQSESRGVSVFPANGIALDVSPEVLEVSEFPAEPQNAEQAAGQTASSALAVSDASPVSEDPLSDVDLSGTGRSARVASESRRRFESEIGRELLRERRMTQELEEVRKTSPQESPAHKADRGSKSNVKELLSRFESNPTDAEVAALAGLTGLAAALPSPVSCRRSDPHPQPAEKVSQDMTSATLPPCLRARAARIARTKLTTSNTFSASLDEDHFLRSGGTKGEGRALIRTQTEPDVNKENKENHAVEETDPQSEESAAERAESRAVENACAMFSQDDDPQRRERIERYKEERRSFLRKKYRSESFRSEQDDTLARLKQKAQAGAKADTNMDSDRSGRHPKSSTSEDRGNVPKSPTKSRSGKSAASMASPTSPEPITCVTVRQRIVTPDKVSLKGCESPLSPKSPRSEKKKFGFSPEKVSIVSPEHRFSERTRIPVSIDLAAHVDRRPAQLVLVQRSSLPVASSERRMSAGNRVSLDSNYPIGEVKRRASVESNSTQRSPIKSPSYCIRDMAALFEAKENSSRNPASNASSKSAASPTGKNFISSV